MCPTACKSMSAWGATSEEAAQEQSRAPSTVSSKAIAADQAQRRWWRGARVKNWRSVAEGLTVNPLYSGGRDYLFPPSQPCILIHTHTHTPNTRTHTYTNTHTNPGAGMGSNT